MKQNYTNEPIQRRVGDSAFKLAALCCVLLLALAPTQLLAAEPGNLPPADTQLAFVRDGQIFLVNADGTGLVQLTNPQPGMEDGEPAWSPDGQRLVFSRTDREADGPAADLYAVNVDGTGERQLTNGGYNLEPDWSPDGSSIVYSSSGSGSMGLRALAVDGSEPGRTLLDFPGWEGQPAWSPDGQSITFTTDGFQAYDFHYDLGIIAADGSNPRALLLGPFFYTDGMTYYFQSAWSPDGQSIAVVVCPFAWDNCYPESAIALVNPDSSNLREIVQAGSYGSPTWSPDGQWIAFASATCRSCPSSIRFVGVYGGEEGLLMEDGHSPAWRPDGSVPNAPDDPEGPVKEPDEPRDPHEPKLPPPAKLPSTCGSKCDNQSKLTSGGAADRDS